MLKYYLLIFVLILMAFVTTELQANPEHYYQCATEPMIVRVIEKGEVKFIAATSQSSWIYGEAGWYMEEESRQAHLGHVYADVMMSDPKMLISIECN